MKKIQCNLQSIKEYSMTAILYSITLILVSFFRLMRAAAGMVIILLVMSLMSVHVSVTTSAVMYAVWYLISQGYSIDIDLFKYYVGLPSVNQYTFDSCHKGITGYDVLANNALAEGDYVKYAQYKALE